MADTLDTVNTTPSANLIADEAATGESQAAKAPKLAKNPLDELLTSNKDAQAEFDRRIEKALRTRQESWDREVTARLEAARSEAERLAHMSAEQRAEHERQQREEQLSRRERELLLREMRVAAGDELRNRDLPSTLLDTLDYTDADRCNMSIERVEKAFRESVQSGVEHRLKGAPPKAPTGSANAYATELRRAMGLPK